MIDPTGAPPSPEPKDEPYFIEVDTNGCGHCGAGRTWCVVGPDGAAGGRSYEDEEDASDVAEALNDAYYQGRGDPDTRPSSSSTGAPPSPAQPEMTHEQAYRAALERIADDKAVDCRCDDHASPDCCAAVDYYCPSCIAARVLAMPPHEMPAPNWLTEESIRQAVYVATGVQLAPNERAAVVRFVSRHLETPEPSITPLSHTPRWPEKDASDPSWDGACQAVPSQSIATPAEESANVARRKAEERIAQLEQEHTTLQQQVETLQREHESAMDALTERGYGVALRTGLAASVRMTVRAMSSTIDAVIERAEAAEERAAKLEQERETPPLPRHESADALREALAAAEEAVAYVLGPIPQTIVLDLIRAGMAAHDRLARLEQQTADGWRLAETRMIDAYEHMARADTLQQQLTALTEEHARLTAEREAEQRRAFEAGGDSARSWSHDKPSKESIDRAFTAYQQQSREETP